MKKRSSLVALIAVMLLGAAACFQVGSTTSVSVGVALPAPWSGATVEGAVPMGRP